MLNAHDGQPIARCACPSGRNIRLPRFQILVGTGRFELPTCRLGGGRTNAKRARRAANRPVRLPERPQYPLASVSDLGRDGQIRTADLSLRRRPLYPSELRPRPVCSLPAGQAFYADVAAELHAVGMNALDGSIGVRNCSIQGGCFRSDAEHATARCD